MQDIIHLAAVTENTLSKMLPIVRDYAKVASMLWIRALGEPTLDGIVVTRWSRRASSALRNFRQRHQVEEVLLRIDKRGKRWSTRRGGYLIKVEDARSVLAELNNEDMIAVFLEPWSQYRDRYCLSSVVIPEENKAIVEVVGPGFDTSDLVRSDLLPHERFELPLPVVPLGVTIGAMPEPSRTYLVPPDEYKRTVEERLRKIGARLKSAAYPKEVLESATEDGDKLRQQAVLYLKRTRQTLLLRHLDKYIPIPPRYLSRFASGALRVLTGLQRHRIDLGTLTFSATFTTRGRFVFWDFFPADTRRATSLYMADVERR